MFCETLQKENEKREKRLSKAKELIEHFDETISEETEEFVINTVFKFSRYIFIRKVKSKIFLYGEERKVDTYFAYCTHCKEEYEIDKYLSDTIFPHNNTCQCPKCRSRCIAKHTRYRRSGLIDSAAFITYDKSKIDPEVIVAKGHFAIRDYTGDYKKVETKYKNLSRYVFTIGNSYMLTENYYQGWFIRDNCCSYKDGYGNYKSYIDKESITRAVRNTKFRYSPYKNFMETRNHHDEDMTLFFYKYSKYPIVEKLMKSGFEIIAKYIVTGCSLERSVNYKQQDIFKFLGLNRAQIKEIKESEVEFSPSFLRMYKYVKKEKLGWDMSRIKEKKYRVETLNKIKKFAGINKTLAYFEKQDKGKGSHITMYTTWFDYLNDCEKLELNLSDQSILFPKSLYKAHQNTIKQIKYVEDKALNEKIEKLAPKREKLKYEYNGLIIRPALDSAELIFEGRTLKHCVGGYAINYAENKTNILFIRKENEIEIPYFTVEVSSKGEVIQVRGNKNCSPDEDVEKFMEKYKKEVLEKLAKKKKVA